MNFSPLCLFLTNYSTTMQRLAGLEEVMPIPDINQFVDSSVSKDTQNFIQASLLKVGFCLCHLLQLPSVVEVFSSFWLL